MIGIFFAVASLLDFIVFRLPSSGMLQLREKYMLFSSNSNHYGYYLVMVILFSSGGIYCRHQPEVENFLFSEFFHQ